MSSLSAVAAVAFNALVWGLSWWPFRVLGDAGLHPLWATALIYGFALCCLLLVRPGAWRGMLRHRALWILLLATGVSNVGFNWAVTLGDVVRVIVLFYLMPVWSVLLAWMIVGERPTGAALLRLGLALVGVMLVLSPAATNAAGSTAALSVADGLAVLGGMGFALSNVMLKRLADVPAPWRMFAMFGGGALLASATGAAGMAVGIIPGLAAVQAGWLLPAMGLAVAFLLGNIGLQYGAARLAVSTTAIVMLSEVLFAGVSSIALGASAFDWRTLAGGALIVTASALAVLRK